METHLLEFTDLEDTDDASDGTVQFGSRVSISREVIQESVQRGDQVLLENAVLREIGLVGVGELQRSDWFDHQ